MKKITTYTMFLAGFLYFFFSCEKDTSKPQIPNKYLYREESSTVSMDHGYYALNTGYDDGIVANTFSYDLWVKPTRTIIMADESNTCSGSTSVPLAFTNQNWAIVPKGLAGGNMSVGLTIGTNGIMVAEHSENILVSRLSHAVSISDWVHIAIVYRPDSIFLFLNGDLVRSRQTPCSSNSKFVTNALTGYYYSPDFMGDLDEFRLWDIALIRQEIKIVKDKKLMNKILGLRYYVSFDSGLFERSLGDIGNQNLTVDGLSTSANIKTSTWNLQSYTGTRISDLTPY